MAKNTGRKNLKVTQEDLDFVVNRMHSNGILQSTIFHTVLFLIMALTVIDNMVQKPVRLSLSFSETTSPINLEDIQAIDIEIPDVESVATKENEQEVVMDQILSEPDVSEPEPLSSDVVVSIPNDSSIQDISYKDLNKIIDDSASVEEEDAPKANKKTRTEIPNPIPSRRATVRNTSNTGNTGNMSSATATENSETEIANIGRRLQMAGAKTGDLQISLAWDSVDDIDLHVQFQDKFGQYSYICWMNREGINGGMLDVDMNARPGTLVPHPVENVFWAFNECPTGEFIVGVHNFRNWSGSNSVPVTILIKTNNGIRTFKAIVIFGQQPKEITRFSMPEKPNFDLR